MSDRRERWVKPVATSSIPQTVVSLSLAGRTGAESAGQRDYSFDVSSWSAVLRQRTPGQSDRVRGRRGTTGDQFWAWIQSVCHDKRNVWIITPDAENAFHALGGWIQSDRGVVSWGTLGKPPAKRTRGKGTPPREFRGCMILSPAVTILIHRLPQGRLTWTSIGNYLPADLDTLATSCGMTYPPSLDVGRHGCSYQSDPDAAAKVVDRFFNRIMSQWLESDSGHWKTTAAQLAHQTWRRKFLTHAIQSHTNDDAARYERDANYGGRAELYYYGTVGPGPGDVPGESAGPSAISTKRHPGPLYQVDVRSQYPALLRSERFPVQFDRIHPTMTIKKLQATCELSGACARVLIETTRPAYPFRTEERTMVDKHYDGRIMRTAETKLKSRVIFPIGRFWTTLYGPELLHAIERDRIMEVGPVVTYRSVRAFRAYADYLIQERQNARDAGDGSAELRLKLQANSFAGKFASRGGGWTTVVNSRPRPRWFQWWELNADTGEKHHFRSLSGIVQRYDPPAEGAVGMPFVFGYLTSYGRVQLNGIIEAAGERGVVQCHTDGLILTQSGFGRVRDAGLIGDGEPGRLRLVRTIDRFRGFDPTHFFADGDWTLSGFKSGGWVDARGDVVDWSAFGISDVIRSPESTETRFRSVRKSLVLRPAFGEIDSFGWSHCPAVGRYGEAVHAAIQDRQFDYALPFG